MTEIDDPEVLRREREQQWRTSAQSILMSTKDVYDLWIIMWMSDQNYAVSQHLTDCPIDRQHNPCKFIKMQSLTEICMEATG